MQHVALKPRGGGARCGASRSPAGERGAASGNADGEFDSTLLVGLDKGLAARPLHGFPFVTCRTMDF